MEQALDVHRLHFAFTVTFHYIFPQLTMGLALLLLYLKTKALRTGDEHYDRAARFWARIFGINFALGVVTGIPMEFQFGTNWAAFSKAAGGVIGQTLAMEGVFSFFLESSFLGLFLFGERRLGRIGHWWSAFLVFLGSWLSGYLIVATDAWMQHPTGYRLAAGGEIRDGRRGCSLFADQTPRKLWPHVRSDGGSGRNDRRHCATLPYRGHAGEDDCRPSADHTRRYGRTLSVAAGSSAGNSGSARRRQT